MDTTQSAQSTTDTLVNLNENGSSVTLDRSVELVAAHGVDRDAEREAERELGRRIGRQIADARQRHGWTQRDLGRQVGIGSSLVAKWEQGTRVPPYEWLVELDRILGTELSLHAGPQRRRRGPRPGVVRSAGGVPSRTAVLVEIGDDGVHVFQGDVELEAVVVDVRDLVSASAPDRVRRSSELLLRSLELPRPLAERLIKRIADMP
ncbi:MAG: Helix-turn-helix domain [Actinomycetota bacterium]|jgi:ribosome-binding protein aMBF1 (putative translation factor)